MKRIGIAASRMSKGNIVTYNSYVVLLAFIFSLFLFVVAGATVMLALILLSCISNELSSFELRDDWPSIFKACMVLLTIITVGFYVLALSINLKFKTIKFKRKK